MNKLPTNTINDINNDAVGRINDKVDDFIKDGLKSCESYFHKKGANFQEISEALNVFYNATKVIDYEQAREAILEIVSDCLEGYAIFPGSYGRRELFDWWLLEVVPASCYLLPPKSFYVVEGVQNKEEIKSRQTKILQQTSEIWHGHLMQRTDKSITSTYAYNIETICDYLLSPL
jgi:hypothetical protein